MNIILRLASYAIVFVPLFGIARISEPRAANCSVISSGAPLTAFDDTKPAESAVKRSRLVESIFFLESDDRSLFWPPSWTARARSWSGWIVAAFFFVLLIFRDLLRRVIADYVRNVGERVYARLAGHRVLRKTALRRYRLALIRKYQTLKIPFRPDRPLDVSKIYVPLKVKDSKLKVKDSSEDEVDALTTMIDHKRLMVVGMPGSGKSMLLRHIALSYAEGRLTGLEDNPIPLLVELNRLNEAEDRLKSVLVDIFRLNQFPRADPFVDLSLAQGKLMLLFDGLDEVNGDKRARVVREIKDLMDEFIDCRVIITCRTAVYRDEFSESVDQTLEIVDFKDQQIQIFLKSWQPDMPPDKSVEQLLRTLYERPQIMALARNPLLLTIIAYLYTDTNFQLPHLRAEFYDQSVDVLLQHWKTEQNRYSAAQKRIVLQHLALFNQDRGQNRRSIRLTTVIEEIKKVLPAINLPDEAADKVLKEILERSGLMLTVDTGSSYQFAHLTLQEFFAADALRNDEKGLFERYCHDPDRWREPVKLWCGFEQDSSELIRAIYAQDQLTAFECLSDAQRVDADLADEIIHYFRSHVEDSWNDKPLQKAFASVASDKRPRGKALFSFLVEVLENPAASKTTATVATILSYTNMPAAADTLVRYYESKSEIRSPLVSMGDIAVPVLAVLAHQNSNNALDDLQAIGTPAAATALVPFLWHRGDNLACAFRLATLMNRPNVEEALRLYELTKESSAKYMKAIWEPFDEPPNSPLSIIVGRIAWLFERYAFTSAHTDVAENYWETKAIDERLVLPVLVYVQSLRMVTLHSLNELYHTPSRELLDHLQKIRKYMTLTSDKASRDFKSLNLVIRSACEIINNKTAATDKTDVSGVSDGTSELKVHTAGIIREVLKSAHARPLARLLNLVPPEVQIDLFRRVVKEPIVTMSDWRNIFRPVKFKFKLSWQFRLVLVLGIVLSVFGFIGLSSAPSNIVSEGLALFLTRASVRLISREPSASVLQYLSFAPVVAISAISLVITWVKVLKLIWREQYDGHRWFAFGFVILVVPLLVSVGVAKAANLTSNIIERTKTLSLSVLATLLCAGIALVATGLLLATQDGAWVVMALIGSIIVLAPLLLLISRAELNTEMPRFGTFGDNVDIAIMFVQAVAFAIALSATSYGAFKYLLRSFTALQTLFILVFVAVFGFELCRRALKRDRASRNSLHGFFENRFRGRDPKTVTSSSN